MVEAIHFFFEGIGGAKPLLDNYIKIEKKKYIANKSPAKGSRNKERNEKNKLSYSKACSHEERAGWADGFALSTTRANSDLNLFLTEEMEAAIFLKIKSFLAIQMHHDMMIITSRAKDTQLIDEALKNSKGVMIMYLKSKNLPASLSKRTV